MMSDDVTDDGGDGAATGNDGAVDEPARVVPTDPLLRAIIESVESVEIVGAESDGLVRVDRAELATLAGSAKAAGFEMCVDVTAVDYKSIRRVRFEVVVNLLSQQHNRRLRVLTAVPEDDPIVPSLVPTYPGTNFFEREVYDMFGISFEGHPDLTRILMPDDWVGHPLRKDFGVGAVPVQFKEAHQV